MLLITSYPYLLDRMHLLDLSDECLLEVLYHLDVLDDLLSASLVCRRLSAFKMAPHFWSSHPLLPPGLTGEGTGACGSRGREEKAAPALEWRQLRTVVCGRWLMRREHRDGSGAATSLRPVDLLPSREEADASVGRVASSSFDREEERLDQALRPYERDEKGRSRNASPSKYNTMWEEDIIKEEAEHGPPSWLVNDRTVYLQRHLRQIFSPPKYWSSAPEYVVSEGETGSEQLAFATRCGPACLLTDVAVRPFRELWVDGQHVPYTWRGTKLCVYHLHGPSTGTVDRDSGVPYWDNGRIMLDSHCGGDDPLGAFQQIRPVYESRVFPSRHREDTGWQRYRLGDDGCGVVGNVFVVTLVGKCNRQYDDSGFYVCVERVECRGFVLPSG